MLKVTESFPEAIMEGTEIKMPIPSAEAHCFPPPVAAMLLPVSGL